MYCLGVQSQKPDALTQYLQNTPALKKTHFYYKQTLFHSKLFDPPAKDFIIHVFKITNQSIEQIIVNKYPNNKFIPETLKLIQDSVKCFKKISLSKCKACGNCLYYWNRLIIFNYNEFKLMLFEHIYDLPIASYLGQRKTLKLLQQKYYWLNMHNMI